MTLDITNTSQVLEIFLHGIPTDFEICFHCWLCVTLPEMPECMQLEIIELQNCDGRYPNFVFDTDTDIILNNFTDPDTQKFLKENMIFFF